MHHANNESVHLRFTHTEKEYLDAVRLYFWHSKELVIRLIVSFVLFAIGLVLLDVILGGFLPLWAMVAFIFLAGLGWFHGYVIDVPRRKFRGDPKYRDEYDLTFSDAGTEFKTANVSASLKWNLYSRVIENDRFYVMLYGHDIHSLSVVPKRAFGDKEQEITFRKIVRRNLDPNLKLTPAEHETPQYVPASLEPPDWR
ncbi:MAG TPA: YcxB family protein [Pyrinomonadaceae bacterium]|nr:YcxB family protein [Pyrinomonadaceae bacterium]